MGIFNKKKKVAKVSGEDMKKVMETAKALSSAIHNHLERSMPNVQIDEEVTLINGEKKEVNMRISIGERDNINLTVPEYQTLLSEMLARLDDHELVHLIWAKHNKDHEEAGETIDALLRKALFHGENITKEEFKSKK